MGTRVHDFAGAALFSLLAFPVLFFNLLDPSALLVHPFPLGECGLDTQPRDADRGRILEHVLGFELAGLRRGHLPLHNGLVSLFGGLHGGVNAVGGMDSRNGGQASRDELFAAPLAPLGLQIASRNA